MDRHTEEGEKMEYKVMAGRMLLGCTSDFEEALRWVNEHNEQRVAGNFARIKVVK